MKTKTIALAAGAAMAMVLPAMASAEQQPGNYLQVNGGVSVAGQAIVSVADSVYGSAREKEDVKTGPFVSAAFGHSMAGGWAIEGELLYVQNKIDTVDLDTFLGLGLQAKTKTYGLMANAMYALGRAGPVIPYLGAGLGVGKSNYKVLGASDDDTGFMWQLRAGGSIPITDNSSWDFGYRYVQTPHFKKTYSFDDGFGGTETTNVKAQARVHVLEIGYRYRF